ncbi:flagellar basal body-associated FliL family protein [Pluralibacter gergoviae]
MDAKTIRFGIAVAAGTAVITCALTVTGMNMLRVGEEKAPGAGSGLFSSSKSPSVEFVEIKNMVVTLKGGADEERYLLLEVNLTTADEKQKQIAEGLTPALRGATVSLLSAMDYRTVREMSIAQLREKLMEAYRAKFDSMKIQQPFEDVIISKILFQ